MPKHRPDEIRRALMTALVQGGSSPVIAVAAHFGVTRQAVQRHLGALIAEGLIVASGIAPHRAYRLAKLATVKVSLPLTPAPEEDRVWRDAVRSQLGELDETTSDILYYGFTEILNNAIDHSGGRRVDILAERTPVTVRLEFQDDGVGIFRKVSDAMDLADAKEAPLELAKGKFTTDPKRHTGEGIFFTSRAFQRIEIQSNGVWFRYEHAEPEPRWIVTWPDAPAAGAATTCELRSGTRVDLLLTLPPPRSLPEVFAEFSSGPEDYRFARTHVPLKLAALGDDALVSRSSAKRVVARIDRFDEAILDFSGVRSIGQAFADEIFRVFQSQHKSIRLLPVNANPRVMSMIRRARST